MADGIVASAKHADPGGIGQDHVVLNQSAGGAVSKVDPAVPVGDDVFGDDLDVYKAVDSVLSKIRPR